MRKTSTFLVSLWVVFGFLCTLAHAGSLDGKSFSGSEGMIGETADKTDEITFSNGQFTSSECKKYGFPGAPYQEKVDGDKIHFMSDNYSAKYGRIIWAGTVDGNKIDATYIWYDKGEYQKPEQIKWFSGTTK
jgi:hypothetical protein